jgi:hypothetical protein
MFKDGQFYPNIILLTKDINFGKIMEESLQLGWSLNEQQMCSHGNGFNNSMDSPCFVKKKGLDSPISFGNSLL